MVADGTVEMSEAETVPLLLAAWVRVYGCAPYAE